MNENKCGGGKRGWDSDSWWEERTLPEKVMLGILFGILGIGALFLFGWIVMLLWNWLMPEIFGLKEVTYWQAWGLLILSCILLKSWGSCGPGRNGDRKRKRHLRRYMRECGPANGAAHEEPGAPAPTV
jgi:hypothetical protein